MREDNSPIRRQPLLHAQSLRRLARRYRPRRRLCHSGTYRLSTLVSRDLSAHIRVLIFSRPHVNRVAAHCWSARLKATTTTSSVFPCTLLARTSTICWRTTSWTSSKTMTRDAMYPLASNLIDGQTARNDDALEAVQCENAACCSWDIPSAWS